MHSGDNNSAKDFSTAPAPRDRSRAAVIPAPVPFTAFVQEFTAHTSKAGCRNKILPLQALNVIFHESEQPVSLIFEHWAGLNYYDFRDFGFDEVMTI